MPTPSTSSTPMQIVSEHLAADLETTAQKAFPGASQSELRREFLNVLLIIAQGSLATDGQLDNFLVRDSNERICIVADCGQRFKRQDRSRDHIRVHLDYRPYGCDGQCGKPEWCVWLYSSANPLILSDPMNSRAHFHAASALSTHQGQREFKCPRWYVHALMSHKSV